MNDTDRVIHAGMKVANDGSFVVIARYDREGRWYREGYQGKEQIFKARLKTVHDAVEAALAIEKNGGDILLGRPGGKRFDYMVECAREKMARSKK